MKSLPAFICWAVRSQPAAGGLDEITGLFSER